MQKDTRFAGLCFVEISPIMAFFRRRPKQLKMHEKTFRLVKFYYLILPNLT